MAENDVKMPDLSGVFDMISKNPDIIKNAMSAISGMSVAENAKKNEDQTEKDPQNVLASLLPAVAKAEGSHEKSKKTNHRELLCALKPYLSAERCAVIDKMLEFERLGDLIKAFEGQK